MPEGKKRGGARQGAGRPRKSATGVGKTKSYYATSECEQRLERLMALGKYGVAAGDVVCFALRHLEENPPADVTASP